MCTFYFLKKELIGSSVCMCVLGVNVFYILFNHLNFFLQLPSLTFVIQNNNNNIMRRRVKSNCGPGT